MNLGASGGRRQSLGDGFHGLSEVPDIMLVHEKACDNDVLVACVSGCVNIEEEHGKVTSGEEAGG